MSQLGLFDRPAPYARASRTSKAAAASIQAPAQTQRVAVLAFVRGRGVVGATDEEIQSELGLDGNTQRPRRRELVQAGYLRDSGVTRTTRTGRSATVWVVT